MKQKIKLGIVIPTFNRLNHLSGLLGVLHNQIASLANDISVDIVVVNDGSNDGTHEYLQNQPSYVHEVLGDGSLWFTRSINKGAFYALEQIQPDFMMILNDDLILEESYLGKVSEYILHNAAAAKSVIGPLNITYDQPYRITFSGIKDINVLGKRYKYHQNFHDYDRNSVTGIKPSKVLPGRGMLFPAQCFVSLKGLDNSLFQYHSDEDFCLRAAKQGYNVLINWDWILFSDHKTTAAVTSYNKVPLKKVFKSFLNKYSRNYIPDRSLMIWRHHPKFLFPLLVLLNYILIIRSFTITRK